MGLFNWHRRESWSEKDRAEFFERLNRMRGFDHKASELRVKAYEFQEVGTSAMVQTALSLLEISFAEYPDALDCAQAYVQAAECHHKLGHTDEAVGYFRKALARQRTFRGYQTNACFSFGRLAVESQRSDCYDEVLFALDEFGPPTFPWHAYAANAIRALIAEARGNRADALRYAAAALDSAEVRHSGFTRHPNVGLVSDRDKQTIMHEKLTNLARDLD